MMVRMKEMGEVCVWYVSVSVYDEHVLYVVKRVEYY